MAVIEPNKLELSFLGKPMATLAYRADLPAYAFELDAGFAAEGHDLSPLNLPLESLQSGPRIFRPGDTPFFGGMPGLIADSLPDVWGERMLRQEVPGLQTAMGKLAAIGLRGPGAITFRPVLGLGADQSTVQADLSRLAREAETVRSTPAALGYEQIEIALARGGSSLGGAFPKIAVHLPIEGGVLSLKKVLIGGPAPLAHEPFILKLARFAEEAEGAVEYAYWRMAKNAGIRVPHACLVDDGKRLHFAAQRFDRHRKSNGEMGHRHVHTLSGMLHAQPSNGAIDYEEFIRLSRALGGHPEAQECFRRAVFNLLAVNRDDHGRNHAFLYDENLRTWTLAPAYDLNSNLANVLIGLRWLGSMDVPKSFEPLARLADLGGISATRARTIYEQVETAIIGGWRKTAKIARVPMPMISYWEKEITQQTRDLRAHTKIVQTAGLLGKRLEPRQKSHASAPVKKEHDE